MKLFALLIVFCALSPRVEAYKLRLNTIVDKMARNNGKQSSGFKIVREVTFETQGQALTARESWWVKNGDTMKVRVTSVDPAKPWAFEIAYSGKTRQTVTSGQTVKKFKVSKEFFEPLFHDRSVTSLKDRLIQFQFIPKWARSLASPDYIGGKSVMKEEAFVNLVPGSGSVNYLIGAPTNADGSPGHTHLWVEQDSFQISKGTLASKSEFTNKDFQDVEGGLKIPRNQVISWGDRVARIRLITAEKSKLSSRDFALSKNQNAKIPDQQIVKEFYSRFR